MKKISGFTLIELLVVISIIGVLSSIILVALQGARQKGVLASAIEFADNDYHKLGVNTLLSLTFDEASGPPIDQAGNYTSSALINRSSNTPQGSGSSLDEVTMPKVTLTMTASSAPTLADKSGLTASVWVNLGTSTAGGVMLVSSNGGNYYVYMSYVSGTGYICTIGNSGLVKATYNAPADALWHNVTCTYDAASNNVYLYYDGKQAGSVSDGTPTIGLGTSISIGSLFGLPFTGYLDNVQIFSGSLLADQAYQLYAAGAVAHGIALR